MNRRWRLWLDDQAFDADCPDRFAPEGFLAAISTEKALELIAKHGMPEFIDFDHDLGEQDDAIKFIRRLVSEYPDVQPPEYAVHSANPVGRQNIIALMESWKKVYNMD